MGSNGKHDAVSLDELADSTITYGVVKPGDEGDVVFVRGGDISGGRIATSQLRTITQEVSKQYKRTLLRGGEVLVSLVGNPGQVAIAPPELEGANIARQVGLIRLPEDVDTRYVSYFLQSPQGQAALGAQSLGSVQQVINLRDLRNVKVPLPPLSEQRAIAEVLGSLDDKIASNRRMNRTLESLARAWFQSWFVDFDPVHASAAGSPTLPPDLAALFPATFTPSALGDIPEGWEVKSIGDVLTLHYGKSLPKKKREPGRVAVYGSGGHTGTHSEALVDGPGVVVGRKGSVGTIYWENGDFFPIDTTYYVEPNDGLSLNFAHRMLERLSLETMNTDAAVPGLNRENVYRLEVAVPPRDLIDCYDEVTDPMRQQQRVNDAELRTLATLRDILLPKLLTGRLSVTTSQEIARSNGCQ